MNALQVYYNHWGIDNMKERRAGYKELKYILATVYESPTQLRNEIEPRWFDQQGAFDMLKELVAALLKDTLYTNLSYNFRVKLSLYIRLKTSKMLITQESVRTIDALTTLPRL